MHYAQGCVCIAGIFVLNGGLAHVHILDEVHIASLVGTHVEARVETLARVFWRTRLAFWAVAFQTTNHQRSVGLNGGQASVLLERMPHVMRIVASSAARSGSVHYAVQGSFGLCTCWDVNE